MSKKKNKKIASRQRIIGLRWAKLLDERPHFMPDNTKLTGKQREGILYERRVAKLITGLLEEDEILHGPWIEYEDRRGMGWCQPDILVVRDAAPLLIIEVKLTATKTAFKQMSGFYLPTVAKIFEVPKKSIKLLQICRNLTPRFSKEPIVESLDEMLDGKHSQATLMLRSVPYLRSMKKDG